MVKKTAIQKQIILSTQSVELLNQFDVEDVIVVDRVENGSEFKRLDADEHVDWLVNDYTLGDLWNKNILGGRLSKWKICISIAKVKLTYKNREIQGWNH